MTTTTKQVTTKGGTTFPVEYAPKNDRQGWQVETVGYAYLLAQILNEEHGAVTKIERSGGKWHVITNLKAKTKVITKTQPDTDSAIMRQYRDVKKKHPDALLLFRCGDFYQSYEQDAQEAAKILGITLTKNSKSGQYSAGFPFHALDTYLPRLVRAGKRVAICDQLEKPKKVTEIVKPAKEERQNLSALFGKWLEISKKTLEHIVLLQDNEEYITFGTQAEDTAKILCSEGVEVTKTTDYKYATFPADKINCYLRKFVAAGKKIAFCNAPLE